MDILLISFAFSASGSTKGTTAQCEHRGSGQIGPFEGRTQIVPSHVFFRCHDVRSRISKYRCELIDALPCSKVWSSSSRAKGVESLGKMVQSRANFWWLRCQLLARGLGLVRLPALCSFNDSCINLKDFIQIPTLPQTTKLILHYLYRLKARQQDRVYVHTNREPQIAWYAFPCTIITAPPYPAVYTASCCTS